MSPVGMRFTQSFRSTFRNVYSSFRQQAAQGRRFQSSAADASQSQSAFQRLWNSPVGIKTVHFWAPVMKAGLVLTGVADFARPSEKLSLTQNLALTATGVIWTRWCFVIKPRNIGLAAVNFFLGCVGIVQVTRIFLYRRSLTGSSFEAIKSMTGELVGAAEATGHRAEVAAEQA